jgi:hypothetical protein
MVVGTAVSLLLQVARRACAVEGLGAIASIRRAIGMVKGQTSQVLGVWVMWIGVRLLWMVAMVPAMIVTFPLTLLFIMAGALLAGVPLVAVGALLSPFLSGAIPWIVGAIVGAPIFVVTMLAPMLFLGGLVEVFKSSTWTLAYRELVALESAARRAMPGLDASGLEAAPVA